MVSCWCGNKKLTPFSAAYLKCNVCETIVAAVMPKQGISRVIDDERDFYGRDYWFSYQKKNLGHPDITRRARTDLTERCLYWLRTLLKYKVSGAKILELGSAHGGFVAMLRLAGFDAHGLELSPWIVDFARKTFDVPIFLGPIEDQAIEPNSLDVIVLMDVLEHLPDPAGTIRHCLSLLNPTGILIVQTPSYPELRTYDEMAARDDPFLKMLKEKDHLYLFSKQSIREFFHRLGVEHLTFEPAIFSQYDMFLVAGRSPLAIQQEKGVEKCLSATPGGRMIQALLDLNKQIEALKEDLAKLAADNAARLEVIENQAKEFAERMAEVEADRAVRLEHISDLTGMLKQAQADGAARLEQINELSRLLKTSEADRTVRLEQINDLTRMLKESDADRTARLEQINKLGQLIKESEADRAAKLEVINNQNILIQRLTEEIEAFKGTFLWKISTFAKVKKDKS